MRLIDADKINVAHIFHNENGTTNIDEVEAYIDSIKTEDAEPVKPGHWIDSGDCDYICSVCKGHARMDLEGEYPEKTKFCPDCGAKMVKEAK